MQSMFRGAFAVTLAGLALSLPAGAQSSQIERIAPAEHGAAFPAAIFPNLNEAAGAPQVDLAQTLGKKPVVFFYWIPGNERADSMLQETQAIVRMAGFDKVSLFVVAIPRPGRGVDVIQAAIERLGLSVPVLNDEKFRLGQQFRVDSVPHIAIVDKAGTLRMTNGASLKQTLEYKLDVAAAIVRVAETGTVGTYGHLPRYYPVRELVGEACPDFKAPLLATDVERQWSQMLVDDKVNVLIFWSVDCPHCRSSLPEINEWLVKNSDGLNVFSAARVTSEADKLKTKEFCEDNSFAFRTLADENLNISAKFQVTTTPTIVIIRPDGVVDSVILSGSGVEATLEKKKRELLKKPAAS